MRFKYQDATTGRPIVSLQGRTTRPRTVLCVTVLGPALSIPFDALLDTGADDTVFPERFAPLLGVDLATAESGTAQGVGGQPVTVRYVTVSLRIADQQEQREWPAIVAFAPLGRNTLPMLGFAGFLQYFTATFHGDKEEVELTVNTLYPGT